jgi:hypothetical protein
MCNICVCDIYNIIVITNKNIVIFVMYQYIYNICENIKESIPRKLENDLNLTMMIVKWPQINFEYW